MPDISLKRHCFSEKRKGGGERPTRTAGGWARKREKDVLKSRCTTAFAEHKQQNQPSSGYSQMHNAEVCRFHESWRYGLKARQESVNEGNVFAQAFTEPGHVWGGSCNL